MVDIWLWPTPEQILSDIDERFDLAEKAFFAASVPPVGTVLTGRRWKNLEEQHGPTDRRPA